MAEPWKIADRVMGRYYADRKDHWPTFDASRLFKHIRVGQDRRWRDEALVQKAEDILARSFFDVDDLVENHLGISISFDRLDYMDDAFGCPVYGCAYPETREIVVCERTLNYEPLYRTTVLHEAGHVLLHAAASTRCLLYTPGQSPQRREEQEANQFMQVAALPRSVFLLGVGFLCHLYGIDIRLPFGAANTKLGRWIWRNRLFAHLINMLCVSRELISIKMRGLGFFSAETVEYHKTYRLETHWHKPEPGWKLGASIKRLLSEPEMARCPVR